MFWEGCSGRCPSLSLGRWAGGCCWGTGSTVPSHCLCAVRGKRLPRAGGCCTTPGRPSSVQPGLENFTACWGREENALDCIRILGEQCCGLWGLPCWL